LAAFVAVCVIADWRFITGAGALDIDAPTLFLQGTIVLLGLASVLLVADRSPDVGGGAVVSEAATVPGSAEERAGIAAGRAQTEVFPLLMFAVVGMMLFPAANDLLMLFVALEVLSLPGLSTFVSEFLVLAGTFTVHRWFAVVATLGIVLAAVYVLWMVQRTIHGPVREGVQNFRDLDLREAWVIGPVIAVIVALGLYPKPLLDVITPSVKGSYTDVRPGDPEPSVPVISGLHGLGGEK
jgi:hypothetical protein